ncbi:protein disabled [Cydia splendana]|uniref:protein disabled n=1 Tax=Cydia splendana TaxID=1100963 RepID=UPI00300D7F7D
MFNHKLPTDFPMQTLRKKTSPCKYKNEPGRFLGEGVSFRAKLIGVLEVPEARGDRMCQEALADLKMAIRAAGEHKQRIQVHVAIDGLRLRDDKTGDSLYHHPVHKISFIAQDMTDSRAFGYIFGAPDTGHRFFGIKTDKAASQVVIAMRDLFQVVFELKKKEIELAKQQLEGKSVTSSLVRHTSTITDVKSKSIITIGETSTSTPKNQDTAEGGVAELVDLEQELSSLRRGLTQVEGLTPSTDPFGDSFIVPSQCIHNDLEQELSSLRRGLMQVEGLTPSTDPFGDSFIVPSQSIHNELEQELSSLRRGLTQVEGLTPSTDPFGDSFIVPSQCIHNDLEQELSSLRRGLTQVEGLTPSTDPFGDSFIVPSQKGLLPPPPGVSTTARSRSSASSSASASATASASASATASAPRTVFSPNKTQLPFDLPPELEPPAPQRVEPEAPVRTSTALGYDVFTELDPLGTGRSKPYVDKKLFFQELKNPPKKVLKDLVPTTQSLLTEMSEREYGQTTMTSLTRHSGGTVSIGRPLYSAGNFFAQIDPFEETDPFDSTDPFSDSFKEDPFTSMQEFPKQRRSKNSIMREEYGRKLDRAESQSQQTQLQSQSRPETQSQVQMEGKNVFNGPLQVTLPPEPIPKSPRLQRQNTDTSTIRQRPQPSSKLNAESASPPPPLPPKKVGELTVTRPPPRPPQIEEEGPPLPRPARKREPLADRSKKPRLSSAATTSSEDEYLSPAPPPLPAARRFDITLSQLLTCSMEELAHRLRVPAATLSSMTLPQLTDYLRSYLAADNDRAHIHIEPSQSDKEKDRPPLSSAISTTISEKPPPTTSSVTSISSEFKPQFEDNFAPTETGEFVANFDDFDKKANPGYDRYAAFREIQEQELQAKSILDPIDDNAEEPKQDSDEKEELAAINDIMIANQEIKENNRSPLKTLDELTLDSFNMFRKSVSPKPTQIDAKIEDIKSVMKNLQIEQARRSVSPRENNTEVKIEDNSDRYAALREITITEPQDEFESLPPEAPKERKRSDEKSDGFDNSDFFDCIDNSSLSFSHVEEAFRKSPVVKEKEEVKEKPVELAPVRDLQPPQRLSTGSISDVASGSSPDTKEKCVSRGAGRAGRWAVLGAGASPWSSDSRDSEPRRAWRGERRRKHHSPPPKGTVQTSSSSRDVSPWDEEPPPSRLQRPPLRDRESRHNSSQGSRECLDSGSGREKDKIRDKRDSRDRDRDLSREGRESRRDSGSGRDRRDVSKERDHRDHRDRHRRSRDRENDTWDRERTYSRERERDRTYSRERPKDYRDKERDRHRMPRHSYDEEDDYSDGCGSGRSSPRGWGSDQRWRSNERNYGSLGWRESRRRNESRQVDELSERRYGSTLGWPSRRSNNSSSRRDSDRDTRDPRDPRDPRDRDPRDPRDPREPRRRSRREDPRQRRDYRFSNDFSPRERTSPFDNDFTEPPPARKKAPYANLEGTRFAFESEEITASPLSTGSARHDESTSRFRFDSDSVSPRSMFEDDFTLPTPRGRTASIAEEDEDVPPLRRSLDSDSVSPRSMFEDDFTLPTPRGRTASIAEEDEDVPPLRPKPQPTHRDINKSESVNIFSRESDPFESDDFFACTGSDRAARRENWPGDFQGFNA